MIWVQRRLGHDTLRCDTKYMAMYNVLKQHNDYELTFSIACIYGFCQTIAKVDFLGMYFVE